MITERKSDLEKKWNKDLEKIKENCKEKAKTIFLEERMIKNFSDLQMEEIYDFLRRYLQK